jgi:hypothetical protein
LDYRRYSTLMQNAINLASRRRVLNVLAGLGLATSVTGMATSSDAKRGKKHRKVRLCHNGNTLRVSVKRKKKLLRQGATRGACSLECTPSCGTNELCVDGRCQPCSVTCNSAPEQCGEALQKALSKGGTVYACPGRYARNFLLPNDVALIGAGQGMDPSSDTILDAQGQGNVVRVSLGTTTTLRDVRITGGKAFGHGGGIENRGTLVLSSCTIDDNHAPVPNSGGGGIHGGRWHLQRHELQADCRRQHHQRKYEQPRRRFDQRGEGHARQLHPHHREHCSPGRRRRRNRQ